MALPPLGELNIQLPRMDTRPRLLCRQCCIDEVGNGIILDPLWELFWGDETDFGLFELLTPFVVEQLDIIRAYHVENVILAEMEEEDQDVNFEDQPMAKVLNVLCDSCHDQLGWLMTDTAAGYGNKGEVYRDYLLFKTNLIEPEIDVGEGVGDSEGYQEIQFIPEYV